MTQQSKRNPRPLVIETPTRCPRCQSPDSRIQSTHRDARDGRIKIRYRKCSKGHLFASKTSANTLCELD